MKVGTIMFVALGAIASALTGVACGTTTTGSAAPAERLLTYREEGGIGGARPALSVTVRGRATLRLGSCTTGYALGGPIWRRLRSTLQRADLGSIAGDYPPPNGTADMITYVIRSGGAEVSIAPDPSYEAVLDQIEPLLAVLGRVVAQGEGKLRAGCRGGGAA